MTKSVKVVAEIGANHQGSMALAKDMIQAARYAGVDYVKFQKRTPRECLTPERYAEPYHSEHSFGATYGEHREKLEFSLDHHYDLKEYAESLGLGYACSVWDATSFREISSLKPDYIKIPSAHNEDFRLLETVFRGFDRPIHISNGMADQDTEHRWRLMAKDFNRKLVPYACTSTYPCKMGDVKLGDVTRLALWNAERSAAGDIYHLSEVGFSGHHLGIALDIAAVTYGARWVERHFTLDRSMKGRDHAASLEPDAMRKLVRDIRAVESALGTRQGVLDCEKPELYRKMKSEVA